MPQTLDGGYIARRISLASHARGGLEGAQLGPGTAEMMQSVVEKGKTWN